MSHLCWELASFTGALKVASFRVEIQYWTMCWVASLNTYWMTDSEWLLLLNFKYTEIYMAKNSRFRGRSSDKLKSVERYCCCFLFSFQEITLFDSGEVDVMSNVLCASNHMHSSLFFVVLGMHLNTNGQKVKGKVTRLQVEDVFV